MPKKPSFSHATANRFQRSSTPPPPSSKRLGKAHDSVIAAIANVQIGEQRVAAQASDMVRIQGSAVVVTLPADAAQSFHALFSTAILGLANRQTRGVEVRLNDRVIRPSDAVLRQSRPTSSPKTRGVPFQHLPPTFLPAVGIAAAG